MLITDTDVAIADPDVGGTIEGATITINGAVAGDQLVLADAGRPLRRHRLGHGHDHHHRLRHRRPI